MEFKFKKVDKEKTLCSRCQREIAIGEMVLESPETFNRYDIICKDCVDVLASTFNNLFGA